MTMEHTEEPVVMALAILPDDLGTDFVNDAIKLGAAGALITPAVGLIRSEILNLLSIRNRKKDAAIFFDKQNKLLPILGKLANKYEMEKSNHGIIFVQKIEHAITRFFNYLDNDFSKAPTPHQLIWLTFKHGRHQEILKSFKDLGHTGATFFSSRAEFVCERSNILGIQVAPQKDTLLSVVPQDRVEQIFHGLEEEYQIDQTQGMKLVSFSVSAFSEAPDPMAVLSTGAPMSILVSIVSSDLQEEYIHTMKQLNMNGGTALSGFGSLSNESIETLFNIDVNRQKKILFTVDETSRIEEAYHAILSDDQLMAKHQGVYFIMPLIDTLGLYQRD